MIYILESEIAIPAFSQTQVEHFHETERLRNPNDLNRSFRRQRLQSTAGHQKRCSTTLPSRKDSSGLHNDATLLNNDSSDRRTNRISFELQPKTESNKTENDGGQTLIRNEIHNTTYRFEISIR